MFDKVFVQIQLALYVIFRGGKETLLRLEPETKVVRSLLIDPVGI